MARILYFSRDYTTHDHRFLTALAATEHTVGFLRLENNPQVFEERPVPEGIQIIPGIVRSDFTLKDSLKYTRRLRRVIKEFKPDILHVGPIQRSAFIGALSGFHPLVSVSWGYDLLIDVNRNRLWEWVTRFTLRNSDAFVGDCNTIRDKAVRYGMNPEKIVTFPWGINLEKFRPDTKPISENPVRKQLGWEDDKFVILSTRSWAELYGVMDLVTAFTRLSGQHPELRLLMLGGGPLARDIQRMVRDAGLMDRVHFPGLIKQADLKDYYHAADLYISTSHSDGTSISMLEALAYGKPVLLTDIPGNQEWIDPGVNGWLFKDGDVEDMMLKIISILPDRDKRGEISLAARSLAESRADWSRNFPKLLKAYDLALLEGN